jgi:hypothetical protein
MSSKIFKKIKLYVVKNYIYFIIFIIASTVAFIICEQSESNSVYNSIRKKSQLLKTGNTEQEVALPQEAIKVGA